MAEHFYYNVARKIIIQTLDIFNGLKIAKYNSSGEIEAYVSVPLQFAPKSKQWYFQQSVRNTDGLTITDNVYPTMAVSMTGMNFAPERMVNNLQKIIVSHQQNTITEHLSPIPYNYDFTLEVVSDYFIDMIQIIEQILVWFNPHVVIRLTIPELNITQHPDKNDMNDDGSNPIEMIVTYNGTTIEAPVEIDIANERFLKWNLDFTTKGFLFQPIKVEPYIKKIIMDTYTGGTAFSNSLATPPISGQQCFQDIVSNTSAVKYDQDVEIMFKLERINNV